MSASISVSQYSSNLPSCRANSCNSRLYVSLSAGHYTSLQSFISVIDVLVKLLFGCDNLEMNGMETLEIALFDVTMQDTGEGKASASTLGSTFTFNNSRCFGHVSFPVKPKHLFSLIVLFVFARPPRYCLFFPAPQFLFYCCVVRCCGN
jgi:hypothetical protein